LPLLPPLCLELLLMSRLAPQPWAQSIQVEALEERRWKMLPRLLAPAMALLLPPLPSAQLPWPTFPPAAPATAAHLAAASWEPLPQTAVAVP
jgi:hypothetical protein